MNSQNPRGPQPSQPAEPGWWQASDGMWYPPESAPGYVAPPAPPPEPEWTAPAWSTPTAPEPAPLPVSGWNAPPASESTAPPASESTVPRASESTVPPAPFGSPFGASGDSDASAPTMAPIPPAVPPMPPADAAPNAFATAPAPSQTNGLALAALFFGIFGFCIGAIGGIVAIILGFLGLKKPNGKGMAITGIILGFVNVIASIVVIVGIVALGWGASKAVNEGLGVADPSTYEITVDDCRISSAGSATAAGTITNTTSKEKSFTIAIEFIDKASGTTVESSTIKTNLSPREDRDYSVFTADVPRGTRAVTCKVKEVRNFFN